MTEQQEVMFNMQFISLKAPGGVSAGDPLERCLVQITCGIARKGATATACLSQDGEDTLDRRSEGLLTGRREETVLRNLRCR